MKMNDLGWKPFNNCVLVKCKKVEEKSAGGIIIPESEREKEQYRMGEGIIIDLGLAAFDEIADGAPRIGDKVMFDTYDGKVLRDGEYRILVDLDILAVEVQNA